MNIFVIRVLLMEDLCLVGYRNTCMYSYKVRVSERGLVGLNNNLRFNPGDLWDLCIGTTKQEKIGIITIFFEKIPCEYSVWFYFLIFVIIYGDIFCFA